MLAKSLSTDFPTVRFNCLCPGVVDTPMSRADLGSPDGFASTDLPVIQADQIARQPVFIAAPRVLQTIHLTSFAARRTLGVGGETPITGGRP